MPGQPPKIGYLSIGLFLILVVVVGVGLWKVETEPAGRLVAVVRRPARMMGTGCTLAAVVPRDEPERAEAALREAETMLRVVESRMSRWIDNSEVSQLNQAGANVSLPLSADMVEVLRLAADAHRQTDGAFDATCRPLVELWKQAAQRDRLPTEQQITAARARSSWADFRWTATGAKKRSATAAVDLGGIAKGFAIDRALAAIRAPGINGAVVEVGGDVACFGRPPDKPFWQVDVQNPFRQECLTTLRLADAAVCTSGDYVRYNVVEGLRYSHIVDPRTGRPVDSVPSATVVAPDAVTADIWATALSVLGPDGLHRLPEGVESLLIVGTVAHYEIYCTPGILTRLEHRLPVEPIVVERK